MRRIERTILTYHTECKEITVFSHEKIVVVRCTLKEKESLILLYGNGNRITITKKDIGKPITLEEGSGYVKFKVDKRAHKDFRIKVSII